jgi:small subunit ribosomal protein S21
MAIKCGAVRNNDNNYRPEGQKEQRMRIFVRDNNVEQALRFLKKKLQREGIFRQLRMKEAFEKPSEKRVREHAESIRRARKVTRKKMQREGLLPMPKLKPKIIAKPNPFRTMDGPGAGAGGARGAAAEPMKA